jgi:uncharacterized RDD family membrane protein YckC
MGYALAGIKVPDIPAEEPELSSWRRRALAAGIDLVLLYVLVVFTVVVGVSLPQPLSSLVFVYALIGVVPTYFTLFHGARRGQTPGKQLVGIAVRLEDGRCPSYSRSLRRGIVFTALALVPVVNVVAFVRPARHPQRRAFHDDVAGTVVVRVDDN